MADALWDWKEHVPTGLIPAVQAIRSSFESSASSCAGLTEVLCQHFLHSEQQLTPEFLEQSRVFMFYRNSLGLAVYRQFDFGFAAGTEPAVFKAFLYVYGKGLEAAIGGPTTKNKFFRLLLKIGRENAEAIGMPPVEWVRTNLEILIGEQEYRVKRWVKAVCDTQPYAGSPDTEEQREELPHWKTWRAPKFIHMQPYGTTQYDTSKAWEPEDDEPTSQRSLQWCWENFRRCLGRHLENAAGGVYIQLAMEPKPAHIELAAGAPYASGNEQTPKPAVPITRTAPAPPEGAHAPQPDALPDKLRFIRRGDKTMVEGSNNLRPLVYGTYKELLPEIVQVKSVVRSKKGITSSELREQFNKTELYKAADDEDWQIFIDELSQKRPAGNGNLVIALLARKTGLGNDTVATYVKPSKQGRKR
jgi:hypothetical protein